jgi:AcrR family transcriptional regulator
VATVQDALVGKGPGDPASSDLDPLRRRAIEAMAGAVAERGYAHVTVSDVLRRAGMSRRTFYRLYANRDECFLDTYAAVRDAALARIGGDGDGACDGIERPLRAILEHLAARPEHAHVLVTEPAAAGAPGYATHAETLLALRERVAPALAGGAVAGDVASTAAVGAVYHVIQRHLLEGQLDQLPAVAPVLARMLSRLAG